MENQFKIYAYDSFNFYYKGDLNNLELWNNGVHTFYKNNFINLYDSDGNFYKTENTKVFKEEKKDLKVDDKMLQYTVIQIDYKFYVIPIYERLSIELGRTELLINLNKYGISGIDKYLRNIIKINHHHTFKRPKIKTERPSEICSTYVDIARYNTKSFIDFSYYDYVKNSELAIKKHPQFEKEIIKIRELNINLICDFYDIERKTLENKKFDRLKYAIKALNNKINNNRKNY